MQPGSNSAQNTSGNNANNQNRTNPGMNRGPATLTIGPNTSNNITAAAMAAHQQMLTIPSLHYNLNLQLPVAVGHKSSAQFSYH